MSNSALSEIYFVAGMMVLILILCAVATYLFFKTYYKEKAEMEKTKNEKLSKKKEVQK